MKKIGPGIYDAGDGVCKVDVVELLVHHGRPINAAEQKKVLAELRQVAEENGIPHRTQWIALPSNPN